MIGLFVIGIIILWIWLATWGAKFLTNLLWENASANTFNSIGIFLTKALIAGLIVVMPFIDQLIAYPKWQQLCSTTSDFEWGSGMNEKKVFGRNLVSYMSTHDISVFPNIVATYYSREYLDNVTGQLIIKLPHFSYLHAKGMAYLPSDSGDNGAIFLSSCSP